MQEERLDPMNALSVSNTAQYTHHRQRTFPVRLILETRFGLLSTFDVMVGILCRWIRGQVTCSFKLQVRELEDKGKFQVASCKKAVKVQFQIFPVA